MKIIGQNIDRKYEHFEDEYHIFGKTIWMINSLLQN